jgi:hypothetical protein
MADCFLLVKAYLQANQPACRFRPCDGEGSFRSTVPPALHSYKYLKQVVEYIGEQYAMTILDNVSNKKDNANGFCIKGIVSRHEYLLLKAYSNK